MLRGTWFDSVAIYVGAFVVLTGFAFVMRLFHLREKEVAKEENSRWKP